MSDLNPAPNALKFISCLYNEEVTSVSQVVSSLGDDFDNPIIFTHDYFPMKQYYSKEMGEGLKRCFLFYPGPCERDCLVDLKVHCDNIEKQNMREGRRIFNVDPGLVCLDQVILASGKPYSHRIYLRRGVYAELTFQFSAKSFHTLPWTYPDYQHQDIVAKFNWFRAFLL